MYGSTVKHDDEPLMPGNDGQEMIGLREQRSFFEGPFDSNFWTKVRDLYGDGQSHWSHALIEAHYWRLLEEAEKHEKDPAVYLMVDCVNDFWAIKKPKEYLVDTYPSFEKEVSRLLKVVFDKDEEALEASAKDGVKGTSKYDLLLPANDKGMKKNILHIAAEQNLKEATKMILKRYRGLQYNKTRGGGVPKMLPLEFALSSTDDKDRDDVAALLVKSLLNKCVRELFQWDDALGKRAKFSFTELCFRPNMKKTVVAVLDAMINPDWPYMAFDGDDEASCERLWQTDPEVPIRYHFHFQILDQDQHGRPPLITEKNEAGDSKFVNNPLFHHRSKSGLSALSQGPHNKFAVKHPVVRVLAKRKWEAFGERIIRTYALLYAAFLAMLAVAFITAAKTKDPLSYKKPVDYFRLVCEAGSLLFVVVYLLDELDQMIKERWNYWKDKWNYIDLFGLILLIVCVPLRVFALSGQWITAAITFIFNVLRIFKYFCAWEEVGLYAKTLAKMLKQDMKIFGVVYAVILYAFSGGLYLALKGTGELGKVNGFGDIVLRGVRAVAEGKEFADDYTGFNVFVLLLILLNMMVIIVFLMNILIAQLSFRYDAARQDAAVQYDIDKIGLVTRVENSYFRDFNLRRKHYSGGAYVNDVNVISDLVTVWNDCIKEEGLDEKDAKLQDAKTEWTKRMAADHFQG